MVRTREDLALLLEVVEDEAFVTVEVTKRLAKVIEAAPQAVSVVVVARVVATLVAKSVAAVMVIHSL